MLKNENPKAKFIEDVEMVLSRCILQWGVQNRILSFFGVLGHVNGLLKLICQLLNNFCP